MLLSDPVPAAFQLLALAEADGVDDGDRELLSQLKQRLREAHTAATLDVWLSWYREALETTRALGTRWTARRSRPQIHPPAAVVSDPAVARLKEAATPFSQRWAARLQDQSHQVREQLLREASTVPIRMQENAAQTIFDVPPDVQAAFGRRTTEVLRAWAAQVSQALTPSWHEWILVIMSEERMPRAPSAPPPWATAHLTSSADLFPHVDTGAARGLTPFMAFVRAMSTGRGLASLGVAAVGPAAGFLVGQGSMAGEIFGAVAGAVLTVIVSVPFGVIYGRALAKDEHEQSRRDYEQRLRSALAGWVTTTVEAHRTRMASAIGASVPEVRARIAGWVDMSWGVKKPTWGAVDAERDSTGPLIATLNLARNAIAARLAQIELQVAP